MNHFLIVLRHLKRQAEIFSGIIKEISPSQNPVGGSALIVIPSDNEIQKNYVKYGSRTAQGSIDFVVAALRNGNQFMVDAIAKRQIFNSVSVEQHNGNPAFYLSAIMILLYLEMSMVGLLKKEIKH